MHSKIGHFEEEKLGLRTKLYPILLKYHHQIDAFNDKYKDLT